MSTSIAHLAPSRDKSSGYNAYNAKQKLPPIEWCSNDKQFNIVYSLDTNRRQFRACILAKDKEAAKKRMERGLGSQRIRYISITC